MVIDVVETGETMEANGLTILDTILESSTVLIERREKSPLRHTEFAQSLKIQKEDVSQRELRI